MTKFEQVRFEVDTQTGEVFVIPLHVAGKPPKQYNPMHFCPSWGKCCEDNYSLLPASLPNSPVKRLYNFK
tara:strand:+ start:423 stop:632 length:210 start_codon:yes stop_codon:yes gene_type:complete